MVVRLHKRSVKGLTTATTIWVVACLGLAVGLGYYSIVVIATLSVIFIMIILKRVEERIISNKRSISLDICYEDHSGYYLEEILEFFGKAGVSIKNIRFKDQSDTKRSVRLSLYFGMLENQENIIKKLARKKEIIRLSPATE